VRKGGQRDRDANNTRKGFSLFFSSSPSVQQAKTMFNCDDIEIIYRYMCIKKINFYFSRLRILIYMDIPLFIFVVVIVFLYSEVDMVTYNYLLFI